jgi:hypothetical protein
MREHKLRSGVNWQGALKQKDIKQTGIKQGLDVLEIYQSLAVSPHRKFKFLQKVTICLCMLKSKVLEAAHLMHKPNIS